MLTYLGRVLLPPVQLAPLYHDHPHPLHQSPSRSLSLFVAFNFLSRRFPSLSPTYPLHLQSKLDTGHYHRRVQAKAFSQTIIPSTAVAAILHRTQYRAYLRCQSGTWNIPSDPLFKVPQTWVTLRDYSDLQNIKTLQDTHPLPSLFPARSRSSNEHHLPTLFATSTGKDHPLHHSSYNERHTQRSFHFAARPLILQPSTTYIGQDQGTKKKSKKKNLRWSRCGMTDDINTLRPRTTQTLGARIPTWQPSSLLFLLARTP